MKRSYILIWMTVVIGEFLVPYILGMFKEGYSHTKMPLSVLGSKNDFVGISYTIWQILSGFLMIFIVYKVYIITKDYSDKVFITGLCIIVLFAIGSCIMSGIFKVDEGREMVSLSGKIHGISSVLTFFLINFVPILFIKFLRHNYSFEFVIFSLIAFIISTGIFVLIPLSEKEIFKNTIIDNNGLWQRLYLLNIYTYLSIVFINISKYIYK